jgi:hypothetical protein
MSDEDQRAAERFMDSEGARVVVSADLDTAFAATTPVGAGSGGQT